MDDPENEVLSKTITLEIHDKQSVFDDFSITYSSYGHEHVSYGPDEPFSATLGVYDFLLSDNSSSKPITIYLDVKQTSSAPEFWKNYSVTLMHDSDGQKKVVLKIIREHTRINH